MGVTLSVFTKSRSFTPTVLIACLLPFIAGCSGSAEASTESEHIAEDFSELVNTALEDQDLQDFDRAVLERAKDTGRIQQADYDEAYGRFAGCMDQAGEPVALTKLSNGLYQEKPSPLSEGENLESVFLIMDACSAGTTRVIGNLYNIQQGNPELLADPYEVAHNCLQAEGLADAQYSLEDLRKTIGSPGGFGKALEDRLPFDPYSNEAQACFVGANMAIAKAAT